MTMKPMTIVQIIPADGWQAIFVEGEVEKRSPLTCWALVEYSDGTRSIEGMVHGAESFPTTCSGAKNFSRFERVKAA